VSRTSGSVQQRRADGGGEKIGRETVTYASNIYKCYLAYQMLAEERAARERAKEVASPSRSSPP